jgi:hypothetical protein
MGVPRKYPIDESDILSDNKKGSVQMHLLANLSFGHKIDIFKFI